MVSPTQQDIYRGVLSIGGGRCVCDDACSPCERTNLDPHVALRRPPQPNLPSWASQLLNKPYLVEEVNEQLKAKV